MSAQLAPLPTITEPVRLTHEQLWAAVGTVPPPIAVSLLASTMDQLWQLQQELGQVYHDHGDNKYSGAVQGKIDEIELAQQDVTAAEAAVTAAGLDVIVERRRIKERQWRLHKGEES